MFRMFGGLEPNTPGVVVTQGWFGLDTVLFAMLLASAAMAFLTGREQERRGI